MCLAAALPAPEQVKEQVEAVKADESLDASETGFYGGWGRCKWCWRLLSGLSVNHCVIFSSLAFGGGWGGYGNGWNRGYGGYGRCKF